MKDMEMKAYLIVGVLLVFVGLFVSLTWSEAFLLLVVGVFDLVFVGIFNLVIAPRARNSGKRIAESLAQERAQHPCPTCGSPTFPPSSNSSMRYCFTCEKEVEDFPPPPPPPPN